MPSPVGRAARLLGSALVAASLAACAPSVADPAPETPGSSTAPSTSAVVEAAEPPVPVPVALAADRGRRSAGVVAVGGGDSAYNYAPSLMAEGGKVRMWWCSQLGTAQPAGDDVLYAEAASPDGPFAAPGGAPAVAVLSGSGAGFDAMHTCDPSVIKVDGTYYMYYTAAERDNHANGSALGVATSPDGLTWTRLGGPLLAPSNVVIRDNAYGAGQASALWLDGWFYLMFTDTTGAAAGWNGAGQFVLRSKDPAFASGVQALGPGGFTSVPDTRSRPRSIVDAFSADWMFVDALQVFVVAHSTDQGTTLTFWNRDFTANPHPRVHLPGPWREGPGLLRTPTGHAPASPEDPCGRVPVDVVRATVSGESGAPTDLGHFGLDLAGVPGCATEEAARVLDGFAVPSPENTVDLVLGGEVVRVERRSVAARLATAVLDRRPPVVDRLEVVERVPAGVRAVRAPDGQVGLLLADDRLWLVPDAAVAELNSSTVTDVTQRTWASYKKAGDLRR
ncbi:glycoside hydrolase family protein [Saccharothrix syringae]|uniref:Beta-xylosidase n=1 Tax=Saccharothrix syringae TaxID=103733 RepID=A0A5Q0H8V0_SACSY|nr:beta-xylosidase [Saccharothrix syringae]QFZ22092.1 beta-xylosidase [Saccharothrix syringae]